MSTLVHVWLRSGPHDWRFGNNLFAPTATEDVEGDRQQAMAIVCFWRLVIDEGHLYKLPSQLVQ